MDSKMIGYIVHRYGTADPFRIADELGVDLRWADLGANVMGKTQYMLSQPVVMLNEAVHDSNQRYYVMAHELGHVILHADVASYYKITTHGNGKAEAEADQFATALMVRLYWEEHSELPDTVSDLTHEYGVPLQ